jgi:hypothetical protein
MSQQTEARDSLSRAIGEFREELLRWIDTELARLREREPDEGLAMENESTTAISTPAGLSGESRGGSQTSQNAACSGRAGLPPRVRWELPWSRERAADGDAAAETTRPPIASPATATGPEPQAVPLNSRQRLDALARLLDHRLKRSQGAAGASRGAAAEATLE